MWTQMVGFLDRTISRMQDAHHWTMEKQWQLLRLIEERGAPSCSSDFVCDRLKWSWQMLSNHHYYKLLQLVHQCDSSERWIFHWMNYQRVLLPGSIIALFVGQFVTTTNLDPLTAILFGQLARKAGHRAGTREMVSIWLGCPGAHRPSLNA